MIPYDVDLIVLICRYGVMATQTLPRGPRLGARDASQGDHAPVVLFLRSLTAAAGLAAHVVDVLNHMLNDGRGTLRILIDDWR